MGLGSFPEISLAEHEKRDQNKHLILKNIESILEKLLKLIESKESMTFKIAASEYIKQSSMDK